MTTIQDHISNLVEQYQIDQSIKKAEAEKTAELEEAKRIRQWVDFNAAVDLIVPPLIRGYFRNVIPEVGEPSTFNEMIYFDVPECTAIRMHIKSTDATGKPAVSILSTREYGVDYETFEIVSPYDDKPSIVRHDRWTQCTDLDTALLYAHFEYADLLKIRERAQRENLEREQRAAAKAQRNEIEIAQEAARESAQENRQEIEEAKRAATVKRVADDPVLFELLQAMIAIQDERENYRAQIESYEENSGSLEAYHEQRLEKLERELKNAQREADDYRRARDDAELERDRTKQELKKADYRW